MLKKFQKRLQNLEHISDEELSANMHKFLRDKEDFKISYKGGRLITSYETFKVAFITPSFLVSNNLKKLLPFKDFHVRLLEIYYEEYTHFPRHDFRYLSPSSIFK